ncbi:MAG TPA: class I SAM-dependent methyltransferase [Puia sp.]|nr:class I SAM-dependent methyltransferase [Puia sp.]
MNDLEKFFYEGQHRLIHKWRHYFEIYDRHFSRFRDKKINFLEIGIMHGGSIQMWQDYFKGNATIYAVDINPECKKFESESVKVFIGSQEDKNFLQDLKTKIPDIDILLDDGGHTMKQQRTTFEMMFDKVKDDGLYVVEDLHTSYFKYFGGGYKKRKSFIEYSKNFIDKLHAWHVPKKVPVDDFSRSTNSLHYYDSVLVIEKRVMTAPFDVKSGMPAIADPDADKLIIDPLKKKATDQA